MRQVAEKRDWEEKRSGQCQRAGAEGKIGEERVEFCGTLAGSAHVQQHVGNYAH